MQSLDDKRRFLEKLNTISLNFGYLEIQPIQKSEINKDGSFDNISLTQQVSNKSPIKKNNTKVDTPTRDVEDFKSITKHEAK